VVVGPDGDQQLLSAPGLMLGVEPTVTRTDAEVVLDPGSTVLLYTDGLVERRDQVFDDGIEQLQRALAGLRQRPVEELSDALLAAMLPAERAEDDVALVAVRLSD
jgi:two-component system, chemotaxis family, sensor kinase Cph1